MSTSVRSRSRINLRSTISFRMTISMMWSPSISREMFLHKASFFFSKNRLGDNSSIKWVVFPSRSCSYCCLIPEEEFDVGKSQKKFVPWPIIMNLLFSFPCTIEGELVAAFLGLFPDILSWLAACTMFIICECKKATVKIWFSGVHHITLQ